MKRVVVFQGLGVAAPDVPLPPGVWQRGQPVPAIDAATWFRTDNIMQQSKFPQTYPTPAANCRMCPPGDTSPDCCHSSDRMPQYRDFGREAYVSSFKPWNHDSQFFQEPPTTGQIIDLAMQQSTRQAKLEMASPANDTPPDVGAQLSGFIGSGGQGQVHLLGLGNGQGQQHLLGLGYTNRYSPFGRLGRTGSVGCSACEGTLAGTFTNDDGSYTTTGKVAIGAGVALVGAALYMAFRKKKR